jgi:cytochrome c oxidase subunit IV
MKAPHLQQKQYLKIWFALIVFLFLTWGAAHFNLGPMNIVVAMTISVTKALLVMFFFMGLRRSSKLTWFFAAAGFFWLMIMFVLVASDYLNRNWH